MIFNFINQNKNIEKLSFSDSLENFNNNINSNKGINVNELTKGEVSIVPDIIKESTKSNIY